MRVFVQLVLKQVTAVFSVSEIPRFETGDREKKIICYHGKTDRIQQVFAHVLD